MFFHKDGFRLTAELKLFIVLLVVSLFLAFTGWGIISIGALSMTLFLVPIALSVAYLGLWQSLVCGLIFGVTSLVMASRLDPKSTEYLFTSPFISIMPRLLCVLIAWWLNKILQKNMCDGSRSFRMIIGGMTAGGVVILNTALIMLSLLVLYPEAMGMDDGRSTLLEQSVIFTSMVSQNFVYESLITISLVVIISYFVQVRTVADKMSFSMTKILRKWLTLALAVMAVIIFMVCFIIDTILEDRQAAETIESSVIDISNDYDSIKDKITYRELLYKLGNHGHTILLKDNKVVATDQELPLNTVFPDSMFKHLSVREAFTIYFNNHKWLGRAIILNDGMTLVGMLPEYEIHATRNRTAVEMFFALILIIGIVYGVLDSIIRNSVTKNVQLVSEGLEKIRLGELDTHLDINSNYEFQQISTDINETVLSLKNARNEVERRIQADMDLAREIQLAVLPPGTKNLQECQIVASYLPAREVGGDFYDYFLLRDYRLGIVIADVSGKGIPAAMFMMNAKSVIKDLSEKVATPAEVLERANLQLCENNDAEMFVTLWLGFIDFDHEQLHFANAGHNPPVWVHDQELMTLDYKHYKRGMMLGVRPEAKFYNNTIQLSSGDTLILYTDGITEACNPSLELFGDVRLMDTFKDIFSETPEMILKKLNDSVKAFENGAEQADDKTVMVFRMTKNSHRLSVKTDSNNTQEVLDFVENSMSKDKISQKVIQKFLICTDEIYSNILKYSKAQNVEIVCQLLANMVSVSFVDDGIPYNPLENPEPDTTLSADERVEGGYGIYLVKKLMDDVEYQYINHHNSLKLSLNGV